MMESLDLENYNLGNSTLPLPLSSMPLNQEKKEPDSRFRIKRFQKSKRSYGIRADKEQNQGKTQKITEISDLERLVR
jgi:hypothetical protein